MYSLIQTVIYAIKELGLVLLQYQIVNMSIVLILCFKRFIKSSSSLYISYQQIFYGETAELFKSWIPVLYPQISCKIWAWANGVKLADHAFRWKDTFKKHSYCALISGITYTLYTCNQSIFPGECVEPFKFRLWQIWKAVGVLILTSRIFFAYPLTTFYDNLEFSIFILKIHFACHRYRTSMPLIVDINVILPPAFLHIFAHKTF